MLFWGIIGEMLARGVLIVLGAAAVQRFEWVTYLLGAFLLFTAWKVALASRTRPAILTSPGSSAARRAMPCTDDYDGHRFFTRLPSGARVATPLLLVLLVVEATDVVFAVDSIPAVIGITRDPFLVFTSNIFAILGLRSLYFALQSMLDRFHALSTPGGGARVRRGEDAVEGMHHLRPLRPGAGGGPSGWVAPADPLRFPPGFRSA